eukprot:4655920-Karenia_brevis.AAC.1
MEQVRAALIEFQDNGGSLKDKCTELAATGSSDSARLEQRMAVSTVVLAEGNPSQEDVNDNK